MKNNKKNNTNIIGNAFSLTLSTLIVKLLGVVYKIPLTQFLGEEGMGYFNSAYTIYALFYILCTAGVPKAVMIFISEHDTDRDKIIRVGMRTFLYLGIALSIGFVIFSAPISRLIGNSGAYATMLTLAPSIIFISLSGVLRGVLSADMKFKHIAVSQIIDGATKLALGLAFAIMATKLECSLIMISAFTMLGVTLGSFAGLVYLLSVSKSDITSNKSKQISVWERKEINRRIFRISIPITASAAIMSITSIIDLTMGMRRLTHAGYTETEAVSLYGNFTTLALPIFNLAISIIAPISITFLPIYTSALATCKNTTLHSSIASSLELSAFFSAPILIGTLFYAKQILSLLFGDIGIELGASLLRLLIFGIIFMSSLLIINSVLEAGGKVKTPLIAMSIGSIAKIIVSYLLIGNAEFGISGAPIGTVISYAVSLMVSLTIFTHKLGYFPPIIQSSLPAYSCAFLAVSISTLPYKLMIGHISSTLLTLIAIAISALLYITLCFILGIFSKQKLIEVSKYTKST